VVGLVWILSLRLIMLLLIMTLTLFELWLISGTLVVVSC